MEVKFSRDAKFATHTNDLNPETAAGQHLDAVEYLQMLLDQGMAGSFDAVWSGT